MPRGIFLTTSDLMVLEGIHRLPSASKAMNALRDAMGKKKITLKEYADHYKIDLNEVKEALEPKQPNHKSFS